MGEPASEQTEEVLVSVPAAKPENDARHEFLTVEEAAALLRINRTTLYELVKAGNAPWAKTIGRQVRISRSALFKWFEQEAAVPKRRRA